MIEKAPSQPVSPEVIAKREAKIRSIEHMIGAQLRPPSEADANLYVARPEELKLRFAKRVELYRRAVEAQKGQPLSPEELSTMRTWLTATNGIDQYIIDHLENEEKGTLTDEQFIIMQDFLAFLEAGHLAGYVKYPTGGGKTVVFVEMAEAMNVPTLVVVPTLDLIGQTEEKFKKFAKEVDTGKVQSGIKKFSDQVTLITYDSFANKVESGEINPTDYACLILDEAHEALSPRRMAVVNRFSHAIRIGFTATPDFDQEKKLSTLLPHEIHHLSLREGVEKGIVAPFSVVIAQTEISIDKVPHTPVKGYDKRALERAINVEARNKAAVELYKQLATNREKAIVFCAGVRHADEMARLFNEAGVAAADIYGEMPRTERKTILENAQAGKIRVLCGADLLVRGYDDPEIQYVFLLAESQSVVRVTQSGGRGTRLQRDPKSGKVLPKHAQIVHFIDHFTDPSAAPVLFSDIAGGAEVLGPGSSSDREETGKQGTREPLPPIKIPGLKVIVNTHEVMRLTRDMKDAKERASLKPNTEGWFEIEGKEYGTLAQFGKALKIRTKDIETYISQAEAGGRTFTTEERYTDGKTIDLFLRTEIEPFIAERTTLQEKVPVVETTQLVIKADEPAIFLKDGILWATLEALAEERGKKPTEMRKTLAQIDQSLLPREPAFRESRYQKVAGDPNSAIVTRRDKTMIFPLKESLALFDEIESTQKQRTEKEKAAKATEKATREKTEQRGWVVQDGKVYVTIQWAQDHFAVPRAFQGTDGLHGIARSTTPRITVPGIQTKFFLFEAIRNTLSNAKMRYSTDADRAWQETVKDREFDFTEPPEENK